MKKILMVVGVVALLFGTREFTPGRTTIVQNDDSYFSVDTLGNTDTLISAEYMFVGDHEGVTCMHIVIDSLDGQDSVSFDVILQEAFYPGVYKLSTNIFSFDAENVTCDTVFDFDFQPTPYFRFLFINIGGGTDDSISIDSVSVYSEPAE